MKYFGSGIMVILLISTLPAWAEPRIGPDDRIRVLCFGDIIDQYGGYNSFTVIQEDPAIEASFIPSRPDYLGGRDDALRNMRMYMPRTREILEGNNDILLFSDADSSVFRPEWIFWIEKSVTEGGLGMLWLGLIADLRFESWEETTVAGILPVQQLMDRMGAYIVSGSWRLTDVDTDEQLMQSLPWLESMPLANLNLQKAKEGARVFARVNNDFTSGQPSGYPLMTFWDIEKGAVLTFASKFPNGVIPWVRNWDYFPQAMMYMVYRVAEKQIPSDPHAFLRVMNGFMEFKERNSMLLSLLSWVEKFGGNTALLQSQIGELDEVKIEAYDAYLAADLDEATEVLERGRSRQISIREAAMRAKDKALIWVYLIEWFSLISTLMISGYILWTLMVRRRMYREAGVTRWN